MLSSEEKKVPLKLSLVIRIGKNLKDMLEIINR